MLQSRPRPHLSSPAAHRRHLRDAGRAGRSECSGKAQSGPSTGLAGGALFSGPLADRLGRKAVLVGAVLAIGLACLVSAFSGGLTQLAVWRFITGLGLGAAMPDAATPMSEYCPRVCRATLTNAMFCGFPLGAASDGFFSCPLG